MRDLSIRFRALDSRATSRLCSALLALVVLSLGAACGSSGNDAAAPPPPPPPPPAGIGPAGGTVNGPGGSSIVVPANALAASTAIAIAQSSTGAPALPAELEPAGDMFAITPHGTAFAVAATVTIPFDPADVPAGRTVQLMKTNTAQDGWEAVAGATQSGDAMSAQTSSLSWWLNSLVAIGPTIITEPADVSVETGQTATFEVVAEANGAVISFQWKLNGVDIPGATASSFETAATSIDDNGDSYSVEVSNAFGSVLSREALLTVTAPSGWTTVGGAVYMDTTVLVRYPSVAVASDGTVYVAYGVGSSGLAGLAGSLRVSKFDGSAWQNVGFDLNSANYSEQDEVAPEWPYIQVGSDGMPVVAWASRSLNPQVAPNEIVVQRWNGTDWQRIGGPGSTPSGIWAGSVGASAPILVLGAGTDQPYVVFAEGICIVFRTWDGSSWVPERQRACAASNQSGRGLAVASGGTAFVAGPPPVPPQDDNGNFTELKNWISVRYRGMQDDGFFNSQIGDGPANAEIADEIFSAALRLDDLERPVIAYASRDFADIVSLTVRERTPTAWVTLGGDLLNGDPLVNSIPYVQIERALSVPGIAWLTGTAASSRITGRVWNAPDWLDMPAPHDASANIGQFALTVSPDGKPYFAITERDATDLSPQQGRALYVRTCNAWCL